MLQKIDSHRRHSLLPGGREPAPPASPAESCLGRHEDWIRNIGYRHHRAHWTIRTESVTRTAPGHVPRPRRRLLRQRGENRDQRSARREDPLHGRRRVPLARMDSGSIREGHRPRHRDRVPLRGGRTNDNPRLLIWMSHVLNFIYTLVLSITAKMPLTASRSTGQKCSRLCPCAATTSTLSEESWSLIC